MTTVVGVDASLTAAGVAIIKHPTTADTPNIPHIKSVGTQPTTPDLAARAMRNSKQLNQILRCMPPTVALVVIEALPQRPPDEGQASWYVERGALNLSIAEYLTKRRIPIVEVNANTLKKWATGDGKSSKILVHQAMTELWPGAGLWTRTGKPDDNRSDALALATIGAQHLGWYEPDLPCHLNPNVRWPKELPHA